MKNMADKKRRKRNNTAKPQQRSTPRDRQPQGRPQNAPNSRPQGSPSNRPQNAPNNRPQGSPNGRPQNAPNNRPQSARNMKKQPSAMTKTHQAMNRQMRTRYTKQRRRRARGGNYILYYLLAAIVIIVVFVILANTLLFNCSKIDVEGSVRYSPEKIIEESGLKLGDNLLHIDEKAAEQRIVDSLAYIDTADVSRSFPTGIKISVVEAEKWFCLEQDGKTVCISRGGKIIEEGKTAGLPVVKGFEAESVDVGGMLSSAVESKNTLPEEILNAAEKAGLDCIDSIDLTDRFAVKIECDGRITLEIGSVSDIESKLYVAQTLIKQELSPTEEVIVLLTDPEKVAVRRKNAEEDFIPVTPEQASDETNETSETTSSAET